MALLLALVLGFMLLAGEGQCLADIVPIAEAGASLVEPYSLGDLRPGMKGIGKTVAKGTKIEDFDVEILGILAAQQYVKHLVLVRVSGDLIDSMGGIASGMSGSPVYIDGKLLGAISYTFDLTDHRLGMITPIEPMLKLLQMNKDIALEQTSYGVWHWADGGARQRLIGDYPIEKLNIAMGNGIEDKVRYEDGCLYVTPASTALLVGGLNERARQRLATSLEPLGMTTVGAAGSAGVFPGDGEMAAVEIEPGSAFGIQLIQGDVTAMALGTVTFRDGNGFVGFGHPFMNRGSVNLLVSTAYVHTTIDNLSMPFKLAAPLKTVGTLTQDRGAGVAGQLGRVPDTVQLRVKVTDRDLRTTRELQAEIANEPGLIVSLVSAAALQGLDQGIDRIGPGTSRIVYQMSGQGLPRPIVRDNMFFNSLDISAVSLAEMLETLQLVNDNEFQTVKLETVELTAQIESGRLTAAIEKAMPTVAEARPGDVVDVEVVIRPYRGQRETKILRLAIPESAQPGAIHVTVRGGGLGYLYPDITPFHDTDHQEAKKIEDEIISPPTSADSLEKLLETVLDREKNHEIVMEYIPYYDTYVLEPLPAPASTETDGSASQSSGEKNGKEGASTSLWNENETEPVRVTLPTRYVIEGQTSFEIAIAAPDEHAEESSDEELEELEEGTEDTEAEPLNDVDESLPNTWHQKPEPSEH